jgi:MFS family permease
MAGHDDPVEAPRRRYILREHPIFWWMLLATTEANLITSVDRVILPQVLPALQDEFGLSNTAAGFLNSLNLVGITIGAIALGIFGDVLGSKTGRASVGTRRSTWSKRASRSWAATL